MSIPRLLAIAFILACTSAGWGFLGTSLLVRSHQSSETLGRGVSQIWGPPLEQAHPEAHYRSPGAPGGHVRIQPAKSDIRVDLAYAPKKKGLLWHRTYDVAFSGEYEIENPAPIPQTVYVRFRLPDARASYSDFAFELGGRPSAQAGLSSGVITEAVNLPAGGRAVLRVGYKTRGTDRWGYTFGDAARIRDFRLRMGVDFGEIDFPEGSGSPTGRDRAGAGWGLAWEYPDVLGAQPVCVAMPNVLNPGPVAARIAFFAPVSLLFFFTVLTLIAVVRRVALHPMNYFFLAAGCFAFQLMFAYLVDVIPLVPAFGVAAAVSLALVSGYVALVAGARVGGLAAAAQFAYMILFSATFFADGLTGLSVTIGAVATLAILMVATARVDWGSRFAGRPARA